MRRKDKKITDLDRLWAIIAETQVCHLAFCDRGKPYLVPMSFGFENGALYFHSARQGHKVRILQENPSVCFSFTLDATLRRKTAPCDWSFRYRSVIGYGRARFVAEPAAKQEALAIIMRHYAGEVFEFPPQSLEQTLVFTVEIEHLSGKQAGD